MGSGEEIFDVVDDNDQVIGEAPRSVVHEEGLRHRAIHVFVFNELGELFLQKRSMLKDCFPGCWDSSASGHLDQGESYDACAARELKEEIGLELNRPLKKHLKNEACDETGQEYVWLYSCRSEGPFVLQESEVEKAEWVSREAIDQWIKQKPEEFAPGFILLWNRFWLEGCQP